MNNECKWALLRVKANAGYKDLLLNGIKTEGEKRLQ
jgi:hypothetical protein